MSFRAVVSNTVEISLEPDGKYKHQVSVTFFDLTTDELYNLLGSVEKETSTTTLEIK